VSPFSCATSAVAGRRYSSQDRAFRASRLQPFDQCVRLCDRRAQSHDASLDVFPHLGPLISHGTGHWATDRPDRRCASLHRPSRIEPGQGKWVRGFVRVPEEIHWQRSRVAGTPRGGKTTFCAKQAA
jgi:hypothetical protein